MAEPTNELDDQGGAGADKKPAATKPPPSAAAKKAAAASKRTTPPTTPRGQIREQMSQGRGAGRPGAKERMTEQIAGTLAMIGFTVSTFDQFDGSVILNHALPVAEALVELADTNAQVRRALEAAMNTGAWSGVVMALAPVIIAIGAHHGVMPKPWAALGGVPVPEADTAEADGSTVKGLDLMGSMFDRAAA